MKIFLTSLGTRGDIEPFLALGNLLTNQSHDVVYCFPLQFEKLININFKFYPLTKKFVELIESKDGKVIMGKASPFRKLKALFRLYRKGKTVNQIVINQQIEALHLEKPDLIIQHPKSLAPLIWGLKNQVEVITYCPVPYVLHFTKEHPHIGFPYLNNSIYVKLTYALAKFALVKQIYDSQSVIKYQSQYSKKVIESNLLKSKIIYAVSPHLFSREERWLKNIQILDHHERQIPKEYKPSKKILEFLNTHEKVLCLTFGSMVNDNPIATSEVFLKVLVELDYPFIVNISSGGLVGLEEFRKFKKIHFVENIPYEWLFKRVYAVVHHGGSGTTHMGLKHGLPSLVIPHIADQFMWNRQIYSNAYGPKGISINKINYSKLKPLIKDLYSNKGYKKNVSELSDKMLKENLEKKLLRFIES